MAERTLSIFAKSDVTITRELDGNPPGDVIGNALNGDAFSWQNPSDLSFTFSGTMVGITFDDVDGILRDDPFSGSTVTDQMLTKPITINGVTYTPSEETTRWETPPPVNVENEYEVTLYDAAGVAYRMVGVSTTVGYTTTVVGVTFDGAMPPPGTTLFYIQGLSSYNGSGQTMVIPEEVVCFLAGTMIATPLGSRLIEELSEGMTVLTLDDVPQPIRWIGRSRVCGLGKLAPVCIPAGVLGNKRDLFLSPNHRVLLRSSIAQLWFGEAEVLVPAKALINYKSIRQVPMRVADYLHFMLDDHQLVFSEGIATESLFTGSVTQSALDLEALAELHAIFPELATSTQKLSHLDLTMSEARHLLRSDNNDVQTVVRRAA